MHDLFIVLKKQLSSNIIYKTYFINKNFILIKKINSISSSTIEIEELITLYEIVEKFHDFKFLVLVNGNIYIKKILT